MPHRRATRPRSAAAAALETVARGLRGGCTAPDDRTRCARCRWRRQGSPAVVKLAHAAEEWGATAAGALPVGSLGRRASDRSVALERRQLPPARFEAHAKLDRQAQALVRRAQFEFGVDSGQRARLKRVRTWLARSTAHLAATGRGAERGRLLVVVFQILVCSTWRATAYFLQHGSRKEIRASRQPRCSPQQPLPPPTVPPRTRCSTLANRRRFGRQEVLGQRPRGHRGTRRARNVGVPRGWGRPGHHQTRRRGFRIDGPDSRIRWPLRRGVPRFDSAPEVPVRAEPIATTP